MAKLKVPSLQHLARNWRSNPNIIKNSLVRLANNPPPFSYNPLFQATRDMLALGVPYAQVQEGLKRGVKREHLQKDFLTILPLIREHFLDVSPDFVHAVARRYYPAARGLMVPFEPPFVYGVGGQFFFPWLSFWRSNPLENERLSLFVTLVDEMLSQDPDLEDAVFRILDFSASAPGAARELAVIDTAEIPRVSEARKVDMLEVFAEGYTQAIEELNRAAPRSSEHKADTESHGLNPDQLGLFD